MEKQIMSIIGLGTDIEDCSRFKKYDLENEKKFLERVFTPEEIEYCFKSKNFHQHLAARFCAKEACIKALNDKSIPLNKIEITKDKNGKPEIRINIEKYKNTNLLVSISHTKDYAQAVVIWQK